MTRKETGQIGEAYAVKYLLSLGHKIIKTNFRWRGGEIDIISYDHRHQQLVFSEIKARRNTTFGTLNETLDGRKITRLLRTALHFLGESLDKKISWRIDLIGLKLGPEGSIKSILHLENILSE